MFKTIACSLFVCFAVACGSSDDTLPEAASDDATGGAASNAGAEAPVAEELTKALEEGNSSVGTRSVCSTGGTYGHWCPGLGCCRAGVSCNNCAH
ncbi:MAG: hypothetical protein JWP97_6 [Labilithrix sp.]|nr:hypothetical protein [Labilithrix sp.]